MPILPLALALLLSGGLALWAWITGLRLAAARPIPVPPSGAPTGPVHAPVPIDKPSDRELERLRGLSRQASEGYIDSLALLPFAKAILSAVPPKTEQATLVLIDQCMDIKAKTHREAELASQAVDCLNEGCTESSLAEIIEKTRTAINEERRNIAGIVAESKSSTERIQAMGQEIEAGIGLLKGIDEITQRSKVIAISLAIEAAHIGEKGRGFQVISGELHSLNERSIDYSDKVGKLFNRFKTYNGALMSAMSDQSSHFAREIEKSFASSLAAVEVLIEASGNSKDLARSVADQSLQIDADLQRLLESLQFQDISRQMVEGAATILDDLSGNLAKVQPLLESLNQNILSDYRTRQDHLRQILVDRAKTVDEKHAITGVKQ